MMGDEGAVPVNAAIYVLAKYSDEKKMPDLR